MIAKDYPQLFETCYMQTLPNGLTIRAIHKPEFKRIYAFLAVNYGSVDMEFSFEGQIHKTPAGVAHYLEHKMFDLPEGNAMQMFTALGGNPNAFTSYSMTAYYVRADRRYEENLRLLLRMVLTPCFTPESVDKERGIIAQEIKMYEDAPDTQLYETLYAEAYVHHPLRVPIAGSVESIGQITAETLELCHRAFYQPANMVLCVEGDLDPAVVEAIAREMTPTFRAPMAEKLPPLPEPALVPVHDCLRYMDVSMPTFPLAFLLPDTSPGDDRREIAADLAAELLCGEASPLYRRLYEHGLIDSGFSGGYECTRGKAMLVFSGDSRDPDAVCAHILNEASRLRSEGFDPSDLRRLKRSALGRRLRDLDSFSATCYRICADYFDQVDYLNFPAAFDAVTEELTADCLTWVTPVRAVRVVIAPKQEAISCSS